MIDPDTVIALIASPGEEKQAWVTRIPHASLYKNLCYFTVFMLCIPGISTHLEFCGKNVLLINKLVGLQVMIYEYTLVANWTSPNKLNLESHSKVSIKNSNAQKMFCKPGLTRIIKGVYIMHSVIYNKKFVVESFIFI